jgi:cell cycle checkpoint control protein RAD9A
MDNDNQWEPVNLDEDEDDEENARVGWNASPQPVSTDIPSLVPR